MSSFVDKEGDLLGPNKILFIRRTHKSKHRDYYGDFKCSCGNIFNCRIQSVKNGTTKSCGCLRKETMRQIGKNNAGKQPPNTKYFIGDLVGPYNTQIVSINSISKNGYRKATFKCSHCNSLFDSDVYNVASGHTISCGCIKSKGEAKIIKILSENNINYSTQKTFKDCLSINNVPLRFDFYLTDLNILIEYDGEQHFKSRKNGYFTSSRLSEIQNNDAIKNNYCKSRNIKLVRIPYTDFDIIDWNYLKEKIYDRN